MKLQAVAVDALQSMTRPIGGGLIFRSPGGDVINLSNYRRRVWQKALASAKVEYRAVDQTRHTFATLALDAGDKIERISKQLGHTNIHTTLRHYADWLPRGDERELDVLDTYSQSARNAGHKMDSETQASDAT